MEAGGHPDFNRPGGRGPGLNDASPGERSVTPPEGAEEAARATSMRDSVPGYRPLFESGVAAVLLLDLRGRVLDANRVAVEAAGCPKESLLGADIGRFLPPEDARNSRRALALIARGRTIRPTSISVGDGDRRRHWKASAGPVLVGGRVRAALVTAVDLTEERRALAALADSEERYRMVERATDNVIWEWRVSDDTATFSSNLQKVFGYPGGHMNRAFEWWRERVHPDDLKNVAHRELEALERGEQVYRVEYRFRRSNGEYAYVVDTGFMVLDREGNLERVVGSFRDATWEKEAQAALASSEERYRLAQKATNDVVYETDLLKDECVISDNLMDVLGYPGGRYANATDRWREFVHPDDREAAVAITQAGIETGNLTSNEYRLRKADGTWAVVKVRGIVVRDSQGNPVRILGAMTDVTEQRAAEQAIRDGKRLLETVLERLPVGVLIVEAPSGRPLVRNRRLTQIIGRRQLSGSWHDYVNYAARDREGRLLKAEEFPLAKALLSGRPVYGEIVQVPRNGGGLKPVRIDAVPVRDDTARVAAVVCVVDDVSEQVRREAWLSALTDAGLVIGSDPDISRLATRLLRGAVPLVADFCSIRLVGADGSPRLLLAEHRLSGQNEVLEEILKRMSSGETPGPVREVMEKGEAILLEDHPADAMRDGLPPDLAELVGRARAKSAVLVPVRGENRTVGVVTFAMADSGRRYSRPDLTYATRYAEQMWLALENARLYSELQVSDRAKGTFLATLGHELRNPLAGIRNALELLRLTVSPDPVTTPTLESLDRQTRVMTRLVDDLLDVSRIESGKWTLRCEALDLRDALREAIDTVRPLLNARRHALDVSLPPHPVPVDGDPVRLAQVFGNILHNAAKYTPDCGSIRVSLRVHGDSAEVTFQDNGCGIPEELMPRLFDLFVQAPDRPGIHQDGLGIGLPLARQLVKMHGGTVTAASDGPGRGSTFTVALPLARPYDSRQSPPEAVCEGGAPLRVLIVDDNTDAAESLGRILRIRGHEARCVPDATAALEAASPPGSAGWDVILLDIGLPDMDGFELARRLRAAGYQGRIIAVTGYGGESDRERSAAAGIDTHLVKPVDFAVLEAVLSGEEAAGQPDAVYNGGVLRRAPSASSGLPETSSA